MVLPNEPIILIWPVPVIFKLDSALVRPIVALILTALAAFAIVKFSSGDADVPLIVALKVTAPVVVNVLATTCALLSKIVTGLFQI